MMWDIEDLVEKAMKEEGVDRKAIVEIMAKALRDRVGIEEAYKKIYFQGCIKEMKKGQSGVLKRLNLLLLGLIMIFLKSLILLKCYGLPCI